MLVGNPAKRLIDTIRISSFMDVVFSTFVMYEKEMNGVIIVTGRMRMSYLFQSLSCLDMIILILFYKHY